MPERCGLLQWAAIGIAAVSFNLSSPASAQFLTYDRCQTDDEVAADQRSSYEQAALRFSEALLGQDAAQIHGLFSAEVQQAVTQEQLTAGILKPLAPMLAGLKPPRVVHSYYLTSSGSKADHVVICTSGAHGPEPTMGEKVYVAAKALEHQAHVIMETAGVNNTFSFVIWLIPEGTGGWRVQGFHVVASTMVGKTAADMRSMGLEQRKGGHQMNGALLLSGASDLAFRGRYLQLGLWQDIQKDLKASELPEALKGQPPFSWQFGQDTFRVIALGPIGVGGKLALIVRREVASLDDTHTVDDESHRMIRGFAGKYPEYSDVFGAIIVQAFEPRSGKIFGTVEEVGK